MKKGEGEGGYVRVEGVKEGKGFMVKEGVWVGERIVGEGVGVVREGMRIRGKKERK